MQLHEQHGDQVTCISFNMNYDGGDPATTYEDDVKAFVEERQANFLNIISRDSDSDVYEKLDLSGIPAVLVYDKKGELRKRFDNSEQEYGKDGFNYAEHITPFVEKLLTE